MAFLLSDVKALDTGRCLKETVLSLVARLKTKNKIDLRALKSLIFIAVTMSIG
jgi:hypothetical protein